MLQKKLLPHLRGIIRQILRFALPRKPKTSMFDFSFLGKADWGWGCFVEDYVLLIGIVANLQPRKILEIGTHTGLGAVILAHVSSLYHSDAQVTTIEIEPQDVRSNLRLVPGIEKHIDFVLGNSNDVLPEFERSNRRFDLVFIDGAHDYVQARKDWENCQNLSNTWVLHDTTQFTGLQRLVQEIRDTNRYDVFQCISQPGYRKHPELTREHFIAGMTLVQSRSNLDVLPFHAHRDDYGYLLPGHSEREIPGLSAYTI